MKNSENIFKKSEKLKSIITINHNCKINFSLENNLVSLFIYLLSGVLRELLHLEMDTIPGT